MDVDTRNKHKRSYEKYASVDFFQSPHLLSICRHKEAKRAKARARYHAKKAAFIPEDSDDSSYAPSSSSSRAPLSSRTSEYSDSDASHIGYELNPHDCLLIRYESTHWDDSRDTVAWRLEQVADRVALWRCRWGGVNVWPSVTRSAREDMGVVSREQVQEHIKEGRHLIACLQNSFEGLAEPNTKVPLREVIRNWERAIVILKGILEPLFCLYT